MVKQIAIPFTRCFAAGVLLCGVAFSQQPANDTQAPPIAGLRIDQATLSVENLKAEEEWYERVLGFKVSLEVRDRPEITNINMVIPGYRLDLIKYTGSKRPAPVDTIFLQQGWNQVVFSVPDFDKALAAVQALNVKAVIPKDKEGKAYLIELHDPEGNEVRIRPNRPLDSSGLPLPVTRPAMR